MSEYSRPETDIVGWVAHHLPKAVEWAEADILATRRARKNNADQAVRTNSCAVGHYPLGSYDTPCGYCDSARQHEIMWRPPHPSTIQDPPTGAQVGTKTERGKQ